MFVAHFVGGRRWQRVRIRSRAIGTTDSRVQLTDYWSAAEVDWCRPRFVLLRRSHSQSLWMRGLRPTLNAGLVSNTLFKSQRE